jgi:CRP-like cAMP-binding protein
MEKKDIEGILKGHPFFQGLDAGQVSAIAECASEVQYEAGHKIFKEGQPSEQFHLIRSGEVALEIFVPGKGPVVIQTVGENSILGWSWLVPPYKKQYDARVSKLVRALLFDGKRIRALCEQDPKLGYALLMKFSKIMSDRLWAARIQILDIYGKSS